MRCKRKSQVCVQGQTAKAYAKQTLDLDSKNGYSSGLGTFLKKPFNLKDIDKKNNQL